MLFATPTSTLRVADDGHYLQKGPDVNQIPAAVAFTIATSCLQRSYMVKGEIRDELNANLICILENGNAK
jgi:hypothetical protein